MASSRLPCPGRIATLVDPDESSALTLQPLGIPLVLVSSAIFILSAYAIVVSKVCAGRGGGPQAGSASQQPNPPFFFYPQLLPDTGIPFLDAVKHDTYYCLLVPLTAVPTFIAIYLNWLSASFYRAN